LIQRTWHNLNEEELLMLGQTVCESLRSGGFVALTGALGAGKTVFARGLARALGLNHLTSPTFTIVQEYDTTPPLYHFDVYRLHDLSELHAIGYEDYLAAPALIVMEWADLQPDALPAERLEVHIEGSGDTPRTVTLTAHGEPYETLWNLESGVWNLQ